MRISINWLKELVDYDWSTGALAARLNDAGLEVVAIDVYGTPESCQGLELAKNHLSWDGINVGEIVAVKAHPNADRLRIAIVDDGQGPKQSVTGAPNIEVGSVGQKVAVAASGARIINVYGDDPAPVQVRAAKLRGERSEIVLCSEKELGISDEHEGIMLLDNATPVGATLSQVLGDVVIEVELTPNLSRCLNVVGVAREVAALAGGTLKVQKPQWQTFGDPIAGQIKIDIEDPDLCARYTGAIIRGITLGPSPFWMRYRLTLAGMRPISNIVDITNYVMLEWGQPLHAFDYQTIKPKSGDTVPCILVRNAHQGETLTTLDGVERPLDEEMLLITDGGGPIALAGGMGGLDTEVSETTQDVFLESANFHYVNNRRTAQKLKLFSEASNRFSKGLPPQLTEYGLKRAAELMRTLAGGTIAQGFADNYPKPPQITAINLPAGEATRLLGVELDARQVVDLLTPLGFACEIQAESIRTTVPYHRLDVSLPADLVEEVARMIGYNNLPAHLLADGLPPQQNNPSLAGKLRTKNVLIQLGLQEIINYTLTNPKTVQRFDPQRGEVDPQDYVQLLNTLSSDRSMMRRSTLPNMLEIAASNRRFQERVAMFEIGRVFLPTGEPLPEEPTHLGVVLFGRRHVTSWLDSEGTIDFFDLKGVIQGLLSGLGITNAQITKGAHPSYHPGRCAVLTLNGTTTGTFGELHPRVVEAFDLEGRVCAGEFNLDSLIGHIPEVPEHAAPPRFPAVVQDVAMVVAVTISNDAIEALIRELGQPLLKQTKLFDVYTGEHIPEGKRSLAYSLTYQAEDRTLTDEEVTGFHQKIQAGLQTKLNAEIRGLAG